MIGERQFRSGQTKLVVSAADTEEPMKPTTMKTKSKRLAGVSTLFIIATLVLASSAFGMIGQTPDQVIQDARREKAVSVQTVEFLGRSMLQVQYHDDVVCHLFGADGREIAFYYYATKGLKPEDVDKLQRRYRTTWRGTGIEDGHFGWQSDSGLYMGAERLEGYDYLAIFDMSRIQEIPEIRNAVPAPALASAPAATPARVAAPAVAPVPPAHLDFVPDKPSKDENDCLLVATEAYARMQKTAYWAKIAGFTWIKDGKVIGKHAVLFYQPTESSNVFMYDKDGSLPIATQSHDLNEIINSLNELFGTAKVPLRAQSARWTDDANDWNQFLASKQSWVRPSTSPSAVAASTPDKDLAYHVGYLLELGTILALFASTAVICFLKGKPVFGILGVLALLFGGFSLWALIGACRIAKPTSWWAGKKYGPEKMDIAHRRFTPVYNKVQKATPVIIDDPVERALERVRTNQLITT